MSVTAPCEVDYVPCAGCRADVDVLRAPQVAVIDERYRFYCSRTCREGDRPASQRETVDEDFLASGRPSVVEVAAMLGLPRASLSEVVLQSKRDDDSAVEAVPEVEELADPTPPTIAVVAAAAAAMAAATNVSPKVQAAVVTLAALASLGVAGREALRARREPGAFGWIVGWAGGVVALTGALRFGVIAGIGSLRDAAVLAAIGPLVGWLLRARRALGRAQGLALRAAVPDVAEVLVREGEECERVAVEKVKAGAEVLVREAAAVPVDGVVLRGVAEVKPWPGAEQTRRRAEGDAVLAGARVVSGELWVRATRSGDDAAWARVARMMSGHRERPKTLRVARKLGWYAPVVLTGLAVLTGVLVWGLFGGDGVRAAACVLALAPCVMVGAVVEAPFAEGLVAAAQRGIVFKDAASVEALATVSTMALCLRGTVTEGRLELTEVVSLGARDESELLATAATMEAAAGTDPIAMALTDAAVKRGLKLESVRRLVVVPGQGITAVSSAGEMVVLGSRRLLLAEGVSVAPGEDVARAIEGAGRTVLMLAVEGRLEAVLGLDDEVREEARSAVQRMMDAGYDVAIVGGVSRGTVEAIGEMLDVTNIRPEVLPGELPEVVRTLSEVGHGVAVVGRPESDGAALAAGDVAISMEAAGGTGLETAVALATDDLRTVAEALVLAREARERAMGVMAVGLGGAGLGVFAVGALPGYGVSVVVLVLLGVLGGEVLVLKSRGSEG